MNELVELLELLVPEERRTKPPFSTNSISVDLWLEVAKVVDDRTWVTYYV